MELIRRPATSSALGTLASAGRSADVEGLQFATKALTYDDIPTEMSSSGSALVAFDADAATANGTHTRRDPLAFVARQLPGAFRTDGEVVQRRVAIALHPDSVVTSVAERKLTRLEGSGNSYKPAGDWHLAKRSTLSAKATKSVGHVPVEKASGAPTSTNTSASNTDDPYADEAKRWPEGAEAIAYLPAPVRRSLYSRIPLPDDFDGKIVEYVESKIIEVVVVRATSANAVAAIGHLSPGADTWEVTMLTYSGGKLTREGRA